MRIAGYLWLFLASLSITVWLMYLHPGRFPEPPILRTQQIVPRVVGTVGGFIAGMAYNASSGVPTPQPAISLLTLAAVFIGATVAVDLYNFAVGQKR